MTERITGYKKITSHPDKDEIVQRLIAGESTRSIAGWLKVKYPHGPKLQVSYMSLQQFRKSYLKIDDQALQDLQKHRRELQIVKRHEQELEAVQKTSVYQVGLANYVQSSIIDYNGEIVRLMEECKEGISQLKELNIKKGSHLNHQAIAAYLSKYQDVIQMHNKMIQEQEKKAGNRLSADYQDLQQKTNILVNCIKEVFNQTDPELMADFTRLLKQKMLDAGLTLTL